MCVVCARVVYCTQCVRVVEHIVCLVSEVDDGDEGQVCGRSESLRQRPVQLRVQQVEAQRLVGAALQARDGVRWRPGDAPAADAPPAERSVRALDTPAGGETDPLQIQIQSPAASDTQLTHARIRRERQRLTAAREPILL